MKLPSCRPPTASEDLYQSPRLCPVNHDFLTCLFRESRLCIVFDLELLDILLNLPEILVVGQRVGKRNTERQYNQMEGLLLGPKVHKCPLTP